MNYKWIEPLGMRRTTRCSSGWASPSPQSILKELKKYAGPKASVLILGPNLDIGVTQTALLTGGSVAGAVGSFSYTRQPRRHRQPRPGLGRRAHPHRGDADHRHG